MSPNIAKSPTHMDYLYDELIDDITVNVETAEEKKEITNKLNTITNDAILTCTKYCNSIPDNQDIGVDIDGVLKFINRYPELPPDIRDRFCGMLAGILREQISAVVSSSSSIDSDEFGKLDLDF